MKIRIKLDEGASLPEKKSEFAAAYDVKVPNAMVVRPGRQIIPLGFAIELPVGYQAIIKPRSGFSSKGMEDMDGVRRDADVIMGTVDADYRGQVGAIVISREQKNFFIDAGMRIAQMTIEKVEDAEWVEADELSETERGEGGFGHSGKK